MVIKKIYRLISLTLFIGAVCWSCVYSQVTIAPTNLFIEDQNKFGTYLVLNGSSENQEISIEFLFGYSKTDENGNREWVFSDSTMADQYSIHENVRAFPQNFILPPGQRQVVRLRINAPNDLKDGTYWARIRTSAVPETPPVELSSDDAISANITMSVEQVTGLFYKKGDVSTGIEIENIQTNISEENILTILTDFKRIGNSPFLGTVTASLIDDNDDVLTTFVSTSIYFDGTLRQAFDISNIPSGEYTVKVQFENRRSDISSNDIIPMQGPVSSTTTVTIP